MTDSTQRLQNLINELVKNNILENLEPNPNFPDELFFYRYRSNLNLKKATKNGIKVDSTSAGGASFDSKELALTKCLSETIERFSICNYENNEIIYISNFQKGIAGAELFTDLPIDEDAKFGWIKGRDLLDNCEVLIPAQIVYMTYKKLPNEMRLVESNSTGAAAGFDHESTLLRGIYEIVERDAFLTIYLNQISTPHIDLETLKIDRMKDLIKKAYNLNLEIELFDITHDLGIPVFLAAIIDKTGIGPAITFGLKASLDIEKAITGSLEEAFYIRPWLRNQILIEKKNLFSINPNKIRLIKQRAFFWMHPNTLHYLNFLFLQKKQKKSYQPLSFETKIELEKVKEIFLQKKMKIFFADISKENFKKNGHLVYRVTIPELQYFYLIESSKILRHKRLENVARFFGKSPYEINQIPHPFL